MKSLDLNVYERADNVTYINSDPYRFTYVVESLTNDSRSIKHIHIPNHLRSESLFVAFAMYSKTRWFTQLSPGSQYHHATTLTYLIEFFIDNKAILERKNDRAISTHFLIYIRDTLKRSADSFKRAQSVIMRVLTFANDIEGDFYNSDHYDPYLKDLLNKEVEVTVDRKPKKTFADVFASNYTDDEIIESLRHVLTWFMRTMSDLRKDYLEYNPDLALELLALFDDGKAPLLNNTIKMAPTGLRSQPKSTQKLAKGNGYHLRAMLNLKSEVANESMLFAMRSFNRKLANGERYSTWQIRRELEAQFFSKGKLRYVQKDVDRTNFLSHDYKSPLQEGRKVITVNQNVLPIGAMFTPTLAERRALSWLAASDRIQASSIDKVKLEDVMFDGFNSNGVPSQLQIKYLKSRASRTFVSPIYKRGIDELFDVYYHFYLLRKNESNFFDKVDRPGYLMPSKMNKLYMRGNSIGQHTGLPLSLLGMPDTIMYKKCLAEVDMAKPFLEIMEQAVDGATRYRNSRSKQKYYGTDEVELSDRSISLDLIAQTRAVMEDMTDDDPNVTAESASHSYQTHQEIYLDRSDISKKPSCNIHRFGADVGDKIYELSKRMKRLAVDEPDYNRARVIEELGLLQTTTKTLEGSSELNEVISKAKTSSLGTGLLEDMSNSSETFIIQDPTIAAIILSYINHLERIKAHLKANGESVSLKLAISHQIYLESLLERFHRKHIRTANDISQELCLPYRSKL